MSFNYLDIEIKKIDPKVKTPQHMTAGSAAVDLYASIQQPIKVSPNDRVVVPTGIAAAIPDGYVGMVCPRSGNAAKKGLTVLNAPGLVDSDYRQEIGVILFNASHQDIVIDCYDRIAQLMICPFMTIRFIESENLDQTEREGGFGSTGNH